MYVRSRLNWLSMYRTLRPSSSHSPKRRNTLIRGPFLEIPPLQNEKWRFRTAVSQQAKSPALRGFVAGPPGLTTAVLYPRTKIERPQSRENLRKSAQQGLLSAGGIPARPPGTAGHTEADAATKGASFSRLFSVLPLTSSRRCCRALGLRTPYWTLWPGPCSNRPTLAVQVGASVRGDIGLIQLLQGSLQFLLGRALLLLLQKIPERVQPLRFH